MFSLKLFRFFFFEESKNFRNGEGHCTLKVTIFIFVFSPSKYENEIESDINAISDNFPYSFQLYYEDRKFVPGLLFW